MVLKGPRLLSVNNSGHEKVKCNQDDDAVHEGRAVHQASCFRVAEEGGLGNQQCNHSDDHDYQDYIGCLKGFAFFL